VNKKMKKIIKFIVISFVLVQIVFLCLENFFKKLNTNESIQKISIKVPEKENVMYSYDSKYYTYFENNIIYICSFENGEVLKEIKGENKIENYKLLTDKNLIIFFESLSLSDTKTTLTLKNYDIEEDKENSFDNITVINYVSIKDIKMSQYTNNILLNVETKNTDILYKCDIHTNFYVLNNGNRIYDFYPSVSSNNYYVEFENGVKKYNNDTINVVSNSAKIIGVDKDNYAYFLNDKKVYKVRRNTLFDTITFESKIEGTFSNSEGVYIIFENKIIDISKGDDYIVSLNSVGMEFLYANGKYLFFKDIFNEVVSRSINIDMRIEETEE